MKNIFKTFLLTVILSFAAQQGFCQLGNIIPKTDMLKMLDDVADLGIKGDKNDQLIKQNESFVNDLFDIIDGDKSENEKKDALKILKKDNENNLTDLLGLDGYKSYKKKMQKMFRPYKRKMKLLKFAL